MKIFEDLGYVALGSRIRLFAETISNDAAEIHRLYGNEMNPKWFPVFYVLTQEHEKTVGSIAEAIGHSHVSVSKIVREMIKAKLVKEKSCKDDKRRTLISLTSAGLKMNERIQPQYQDLQKVMDEVSSKAKNNLLAALGEWEDLFKEKSLLKRVSEQRKKRESADIRIVAYKPEHQSAFKKLNEEWIKTYFKIEKADSVALDDPDNYILKRGGHIFVALDQGQVVGVCALLKRDHDTYPWELAKMAVSPKAQGKSIGWLLGCAVVDKARQLKAKHIFLESNTILTPAIRLYEKLGFKEIKGPPSPYERANIQMELKI